MKPYYKVFLLLAITGFFSACALDDVDIGNKDSFIKFFDEGEGLSVEVTSDGGFICIGSFDDDLGTVRAQLFKTDEAGNTDWFVTYDNVFGRSVKILDGTGYVFVGDSIKELGPGEFISSMTLFVTDNQGSVLRNFTQGDPLEVEDFHGNAVTIDPLDGNAIVLGTFEDLGFDKMFLAKIDLTNMSMLWFREYGVDLKNNETGKSVHINGNGEVIWTGSVFTQDEGTFDSFLRIYAAIQDSETTNGPAKGEQDTRNFFAEDIQPASTGFAIVGRRENADGTLGIGLLIRTDQNGNIITNSERTYPPEETQTQEFEISELNSVSATSDGGMIVLGSVTVGGFSNFMLVKTDGSGNIEFTKTFGGSGDETGGTVRQSTDGSYIIFGTSTFQGLDRMTLVKTTPRGEIN